MFKDPCVAKVNYFSDTPRVYPQYNVTFNFYVEHLTLPVINLKEEHLSKL